jgi:hypothetical protein
MLAAKHGIVGKHHFFEQPARLALARRFEQFVLDLLSVAKQRRGGYVRPRRVDTPVPTISVYDNSGDKKSRPTRTGWAVVIDGRSTRNLGLDQCFAGAEIAGEAPAGHGIYQPRYPDVVT